MRDVPFCSGECGISFGSSNTELELPVFCDKMSYLGDKKVAGELSRLEKQIFV